MAVHLRDLHGLDDFRAVVALEQEIWGYTDPADIITVPVFIITLKRGGILVGAFDDQQRLVGFAFSIVGVKHGKPTQWSHMMGVVAEHRGSGLGRVLKLAQRERAIAAGFELMEWTFDPLQALNAHLNFSKLGVVCDEYARNVYGESTSALHRGTPTDRFVVEWHLRSPHVERRIARAGESGGNLISVRAAEASDAPVVNEAVRTGLWTRPSAGDLTVEGPRVWVEIPDSFTQMQQQAPELALEWRHHTREIFETYFARGYRAVDFQASRRRYLLALRPENT
jgi:predicted GNAT superfamily acetyltransferase